MDSHRRLAACGWLTGPTLQGVTPEAELARGQDLAWAEALTGLARVAVTLSARLRELHSSEDAPAAPAGGTTPQASPKPAAGLAAAAPRGGFGPRQEAVLALSGLDSALGLAASEVATAVGLSASNSTTLLNGLAKLEALERVPAERPIRWRRARA